jgi:hypothetical protein
MANAQQKTNKNYHYLSGSDKQVLYPSVDAFDETDHIDTLQLHNDIFFQERYY